MMKACRKAWALGRVLSAPQSSGRDGLKSSISSAGLATLEFAEALNSGRLSTFSAPARCFHARQIHSSASSQAGAVCIVTGASQGLGAASAVALAGQGARVVINHEHGEGHKAKADEVANQVKQAGGEALVLAGDVSKPDDMKRLFADTVAQWQTVDVLLNNAGITEAAPTTDMTIEQWQKVIDVNLTGIFIATKIGALKRGKVLTTELDHRAWTQCALDIMVKNKRGRIISMSSVCGTDGQPLQANYAAAKAGILGLTKTLAKEFASIGITCNAIAPGMVDTEMVALTNEQFPGAIEQLLAFVPMGRLATKEEVTEMVKYLALNPGGAFITGQTIEINGGQRMA